MPRNRWYTFARNTWHTFPGILTETLIAYSLCWLLVLFFYHLFSSIQIYQNAQAYPRSTNLFCFLSVGNPKTVLKGGYSGWRGGSSFASRWIERWQVWACKCAYDCGLAFIYHLFLFQLYGIYLLCLPLYRSQVNLFLLMFLDSKIVLNTLD